MLKKIVLTASLATALGASAVLAQSAAIAERIKNMEEVIKATRPVGAMMRGETKFDLAPVQAALKTMSAAAKKAPSLFPDDSKTGGDTKALPIIWEKKAEFIGIYDKLAKDSDAALVSIKDEATFKSEWPKVTSACGTCHKTFKAR